MLSPIALNISSVGTSKLSCHVLVFTVEIVVSLIHFYFLSMKSYYLQGIILFWKENKL